jgi:hypothetical protein
MGNWQARSEQGTARAILGRERKEQHDTDNSRPEQEETAMVLVSV